jgi:hypothetical protein
LLPWRSSGDDRVESADKNEAPLAAHHPFSRTGVIVQALCVQVVSVE